MCAPPEPELKVLSNRNALDEVLRSPQPILVFLGSDHELLVRNGVLTNLASAYDVTFAMSAASADKLRDVAATFFSSSNVVEIDLRLNRWRRWCELHRQDAQGADRITYAAPVLHNDDPRAVHLARLVDKRTRGGVSSRSLPIADVLWRWSDLPLPTQFKRVLLALHRRLVRKYITDRFDRCMGELAPSPHVLDLLDRAQPLFVVVLHSQSEFLGLEALWACQLEDVVSVLVQTKADDLETAIIPHWPNFVVTIDEESKTQASRLHGLVPSRIHSIRDQSENAAHSNCAKRLVSLCSTVFQGEGINFRRRRVSRKQTSISHQYGADHIARRFCGIENSSPGIPGYWMHGWIPAYHNVHPALIALHKTTDWAPNRDHKKRVASEKVSVPQWVSRADQADFLQENGYAAAKAIGLPIVYLPTVRVPRIAGSLLVMPPHGRKEDRLARSYADAILDIKDRFERVVVGINQVDYARGDWVDAFKKKDLELVVTVDPSDRSTLIRLKRILSSFEFVTTNAFGSHIAYAAYFGAKVSVFGPFSDFPMNRMTETHAVQLAPDLSSQAHYLCTEGALRRNYPFLFVDPDQAVSRPEWGTFEVGDAYKLSPREMADLFGWTEDFFETRNLGAGNEKNRDLWDD